MARQADAIVELLRNPDHDTRVLGRLAFYYAKMAHEGDMRKVTLPGEQPKNYFDAHSKKAALELNELGANQDAIDAALLHDTVEMGHASYNDLRRWTNPKVEQIVRYVSKDETIADKTEQKLDMFNRLSQDTALIEAIEVKIAENKATILDSIDEIKAFKNTYHAQNFSFKPAERVAFARQILNVGIIRQHESAVLQRLLPAFKQAIDEFQSFVDEYYPSYTNNEKAA